MAFDAGASRSPLIHADVESLSTVLVGEGARRLPGEGHRVRQLFGVRFGEGTDVAVDHGHEMTRSIWIGVEDEKGPGATLEDQILGVVTGGQRVAEDAATRGARPSDVGHAPRSPEAIHAAGPSLTC